MEGERAIVRAGIARDAVERPSVEHYVVGVGLAEISRGLTPMTSRGDGQWEATLPPVRAESIVRYRIVGGHPRPSAVFPRAGEPFTYLSYFVAPRSDLTTTVPTYRLSIAGEDWLRLQQNIAEGRVEKDGCTPNPSWNDKVPAVLVVDGEVYDVRVRYQGSGYNRNVGPPLLWWPSGGPSSAPPVMRALSWRISVPRWEGDDIDRTIVLSKRGPECSYLTASVASRIFQSVGIPAPQVTTVRLVVNGTYYHQMVKIEHPGRKMLNRSLRANELGGTLFKAVGFNGEDGPYTWADGRPLTGSSRCDLEADALYDYNYARKFPNEKGGAEPVARLLRGLAVARREGPQATREYLERNFDLNRLLTYVAIVNWAGAWDDFFQNYFLYRRPDDRWLILPWDFDGLFGRNLKADASFFIGRHDDRSNRVYEGVRWKNDFKEALFRAFRDEFERRLRELVASQLSAERIGGYIDAAVGSYDAADAATSASGAACNAHESGAEMKEFVRLRNARVAASAFE